MEKQIVEVRHIGGYRDGEYLFYGYGFFSVGDTVLLDTQHGFQVGEVRGFLEELPESRNENNMREIICKLDFKSFNERQALKEKKKELKKKVDARFKEVSKEFSLRQMMKEDEELKNLVNELEEIEKEIK